MAQSQLALSQKPIGYFTVPIGGYKFIGPSVVTPANGQLGGGLEVRFPSPLTIGGATWHPI